MKNVLTILTIYLAIILSIAIIDLNNQNTQTENIKEEQKIEEKQEVKDIGEKDDTESSISILYMSILFASLNMLFIGAGGFVEQDSEEKELKKFVKKTRFN